MGVAAAGRAQFLSNDSGEAPSVVADPKPTPESESLGDFLVRSREKRGVSLADVVKETRIPNHYVRMMESNDYSLISDRLYVLPFLRRYATFLHLDPEEVGMRFVREVQRADNAVMPRSLEPIEIDRHKNGKWSWALLLAGLLGIIALAWMVQSHLRARRAAVMNTAISEGSSASR
jgi:cytoskeletal protein RodZ